jgi:hypothetical protein
MIATAANIGASQGALGPTAGDFSPIPTPGSRDHGPGIDIGKLMAKSKALPEFNYGRSTCPRSWIEAPVLPERFLDDLAEQPPTSRRALSCRGGRARSRRIIERFTQTRGSPSPTPAPICGTSTRRSASSRRRPAIPTTSSNSRR